MKKTIQDKNNKSNQSDKIQLDNIMNTNNDIKCPIKNKINDKDKINGNDSKKNSNKFSISNFLNIKKKRIKDKKKEFIEKYNHKIKIDLSDEDNNINEIENLNITNGFEMLNYKIIDIIKSDIFDYDKNFEKDIKKNTKKNFWKNLIFRKFGGQNKLLLEIIKEIKEYELKNYKKNKIENSIININTENFEKKQGNENEILHDNSTVSQQKANNTQNRNNIIVIQLDGDEDKEDKKNNNNEDIEKEKNEEKSNDKYNMVDIYNYKNIFNFDNLSENEKLLIEIDNLKGLETESKFLKNFLYNENYFEENNIFFPEDFDDDEITNDIIEENNILRQTISLKLYASLKIVFPSLDKKIFQKNITYLEHLANTIDKMIGNSYLLIIDIILSRIKEEVIKKKAKKKQNNKLFN